MVASPGAPGGSIMTALPFLYMISGDNAIGVIVDTIYKKFFIKEETQEA